MDTLKSHSHELEHALHWLEAGEPVVVATVISTWGSSPRPVGSYMVINTAQDFMGSVSGGCVEGAVISEAIEVLDSGGVRVLEFSVSNEQAWDVGLSCGGSISVLIERHVDPATLRAAVDLLRSNSRFALISSLENGDCCLLEDGAKISEVVSLPASIMSQQEALQPLLNKGQSQLLTSNGQRLFIRCFRPTVKLIIIGAVHISQVLAPMARLLGYQVSIIEPRELFARDERFVDQQVLNSWPDEAIDADDIDAGTAIVTLTHDPKIDDIALEMALNSNAFYIGSLGSKRTHQQRVERLSEKGLSSQLSRIHAPVGLNLGGRAPSEIALAVLAQIVQAQYQ
ncbi:MAG: XdhC family protein [Halopseudomonas sp.]